MTGKKTPSGIGERFQQETKYNRRDLGRYAIDWSNQPDIYKEYPQAPKVALKVPILEGGRPIWQVLRERRSVRRFKGGAVTKAELSQLLWAAQGISHSAGGYQFRTAPSAGALYPIETYLAVHRVQGVDAGLYHYAVRLHALEQLRMGDYRQAAAQAALDQRMAHDAGLIFLWTAIFQRSVWKYRQRAYRYVYLDAGHIAQNVALAATALGLGSCQIAALYDEEANVLLGVDGEEESVIYMTVVGRDG
ncbi:SagB/ThcOx family dehydrogenase [candidate division KSB1 bacterium]|nr:SagB/ThcOx family dehydrogenase [candidate division KSB1 bacterium]